MLVATQTPVNIQSKSAFFGWLEKATKDEMASVHQSLSETLEGLTDAAMMTNTMLVMTLIKRRM